MEKQFVTRAKRRENERKLRKANKRKTLTTLAVAGAIGITQFAGVGAAVAAPTSQSAVKISNSQHDIASPTLKGLSLRDGVLTGVFLGDQDNKQPKYTMDLVAAEDNSGYEGIKKAHDKALEAYEALADIEPNVEAEFQKWSNVRYTFDTDGTNAKAHLSNGDVWDFDTLDEAKEYAQSVYDDYRSFLIDYSKATNEYQMARNALNNYKPAASLTNYTLTIDGSESGFGSGPVTNEDGDAYGEGGYLQVEGAPEGSLFHIVENQAGVMVLDITFEAKTPIIETRVGVELLAPVPEEAPEEEEEMNVILPDRTFNVDMPYYDAVEVDVVSDIAFSKGAAFSKLEVVGDKDSANQYYLNYKVAKDGKVSITSTDFFEFETFNSFDYVVTDTAGKTYTGTATINATYPGVAPGLLSPIHYDSSDERTGFFDVTGNLGIWKTAFTTEGLTFNHDDRLVGSYGAYATPDAGYGRQGQRVALRPTANDIAGPRANANETDRVDPNSMRNVFDYSTLQVKDPETGLWTSTSYEGKNGLVSVLPAEGTDSSVLRGNNEYAEALIAFDPTDRSALVSEQTEYRIGIVKYGDKVDDVEEFWANANAGDYVSSTATFGITEHDFYYDYDAGLTVQPYCYTEDNPADSLKNREHGYNLDSDKYVRSGSSTGSGLHLRCAPVGVKDEAEVASGETTVVDVLKNDEHITVDNYGTEFKEENYKWNTDSLRLIDEDGEKVMTLKTENGVWNVVDGKLEFTANKGIKGTEIEEVKYTATQIWVGNPEDPAYGPYYDFMSKRAGGTISLIATTVIINGEAEAPPVVPEPEVPVVPAPEPEPEVPVVPVVPEPEVPVVPEPEPEVPVVPEPEVPVVPEPETPVVPEPEVPVVPEPEVPVVPEPETPVVPEPEVPVVPEPEVPVVPEPETPVVPEPEIIVPETVVENPAPEVPTTSDTAKGETPTVSGMELSEFLALYAAGTLGIGAMAYLGLRRLKERDAQVK